MGARYEFKCPTCHYHTEVSGGMDCGFTAVVITIFCEDCQELHDAWIDDVNSYELPPGWKPEKLSCPVSADHKVRAWGYPDKCPKCGSIMDRGELTVL